MLLALRTKIAELNILVHSNNIFELSSVMPILGQGTTNGNHQILGVDDEAEDDDVSEHGRQITASQRTNVIHGGVEKHGLLGNAIVRAC
ncbi:hypothetical protein TNCV_367961 [Trichonephila clavipes]|nr:hypothetical protein TNCV_367961 [Trichonephila clavipes]